VPDALQFLVELGAGPDDVFSADTVALWPAGVFDELVAQGLLIPAETATHATCNACSEDHDGEVIFVESPPGSGKRAYIMCPEAGRVRIELDRLRQWAVDQLKLKALLPAASGSTSTDGTGFVFKRDGENWVVRFGNEHGSFKPIDGLTYIARLLANPVRKFSAEELKRATAVANAPSKALTEASGEILDGQVGMTKETVQKAADEKTIRECRGRLTEIGVEREAAREAGDIEKLDDLEEEEKKINDYLAATQNVRGESRPLADPQRSVFNAVKQAIDRAIKKFKSAHPPLPQFHDYLSQTLDSRNGVFEYRPSQPAPTWEL
jgi:hypothetical protein